MDVKRQANIQHTYNWSPRMGMGVGIGEQIKENESNGIEYIF